MSKQNQSDSLSIMFFGNWLQRKFRTQLIFTMKVAES
jgi:hypothetical protein